MATHRYMTVRGRWDRQIDCRPDADDTADGYTAVDLAYRELRYAGVNPGQPTWQQGMTYNNLGTGLNDEGTYTLVGFTPDEEQMLYTRIRESL